MARHIKRMIKITLWVLLVFLLSVLLVNLLQPLMRHELDREERQRIDSISFRSSRTGSERIACIDANEDALLWRLRMIEAAKERILFSSFDLRTDNSGTAVLTALYQAAEKGVRVRILLDGIYQPMFLNHNDTFDAFCRHDNIEVRFYNPVCLKNIYRLNYRMHDKYLVIDDNMYLLGGRNTNDLFLGDYQKTVNTDREILVYEEEEREGSPLSDLASYFEQIWDGPYVKLAGACSETGTSEEEDFFRTSYEELRKTFPDMETFGAWEKETWPVEKVTLISNGTKAGIKQPAVFYTVACLLRDAKDVLIQTPYAVCDEDMYEMLKNTAESGNVSLILNSVEKGSNPWGCTDYLNSREKLLETGTIVYELMNESAVHTKTIAIDEDISVVGSYNLDMRSTYLDTELMLVIDDTRLNSHIRAMAEEYKTKSRMNLPDGSVIDGALYVPEELGGKRRWIYGMLRILIRPLRHLL